MFVGLILGDWLLFVMNLAQSRYSHFSLSYYYIHHPKGKYACPGLRAAVLLLAERFLSHLFFIIFPAVIRKIA